MIAELGHYLLILALFTALVQGLFPAIAISDERIVPSFRQAMQNSRIRGGRKYFAWAFIVLQVSFRFIQKQMKGHVSNTQAVSFVERTAKLQFVLLALSFAALTATFITSDFSVKLAASHSHSMKPFLYKISGVWGNHEGSILLWTLMLALYGALIPVFGKHLPQTLRARAIGIQGLLAFGFLAFILFTSNPFERLNPVPADGLGLNPLLQDPGLAIHPPMLYMGYVGFSVVFAFAIAAMLSGKLDTAWARWSRPWTTTAWLFLTIGITLGSWWAYYELGWGGWWFWDPVENASFMPWLVGTALIHSLAVTEKRGAFKAWTVLLAILAFSLSLLGTFLVRSGILTSVHSFASDPARGLFILIFLLLVVGGSLLLYALRAHKLNSDVHYQVFSKETSLLMNNVLFVVAAFMVLAGTLAPLVADAVSGAKISVGAPYFDFMFAVLTIPLAVIVGVGSASRWKRDEPQRFLPQTGIILLASLLLSGLFTWLLTIDRFSWGAFAGLALGIWVGLWSIFSIIERLKNQDDWLAGLRKIPSSIWGMSVAHFGIAIFVVGVTHVNTYSQEKDVRLNPGESYEMAGYRFEFDGVTRQQGPNYVANEGRFLVSVSGAVKANIELKPQKRFYSSGNPMTEAAINTTLGRDLYISLGEELEQGAWTVRLYLRSFVACIWLGALLMALGGLIATADRRYRRPIKKVSHSQLADMT